MKTRDNKTLILELLRQQQSALTIKEIEAALSDKVAIRSLRRWLSDLVAQNSVTRIGKGRASRYQIFSVMEFVASPNKKTMDYVSQPLVKRNPVTYNLKWFDSYIPNGSSYLTEDQIYLLKQAGQREVADAQAGTYARHIYNRLLIDLSYNSSRLEGNTYSLLDTERLIIEGAGVEGKLDEEKTMILNHKEAIRHLIDKASTVKIDDNEIYTLHYLLSDGLVSSSYAGKVRDHGVRISQSTYIPYENPNRLRAQLKLICAKAADIIEPFEQSLFLLAHIAYLQAFADVNKRTSRLSANIPLIKNNFVPVSFNDVDKDDYISAMIAIYELNDVQPLIELYIASYLRTCEMYSATVEAIGFDEIRVRYRQQRREVIRHIVVNKLCGKVLNSFILTQSKLVVQEADRKNFIEDVEEDLQELNSARIAGIGISIQQLNDWLEMRDRKQK